MRIPLFPSKCCRCSIKLEKMESSTGRRKREELKILNKCRRPERVYISSVSIDCNVFHPLIIKVIKSAGGTQYHNWANVWVSCGWRGAPTITSLKIHKSRAQARTNRFAYIDVYTYIHIYTYTRLSSKSYFPPFCPDLYAHPSAILYLNEIQWASARDEIYTSFSLAQIKYIQH